METLASLDVQLENLRRSKEHIFSLDAPISTNSLPASFSLPQAIYLQYAYHITLLDIHRSLAIPWSQHILTIMLDPSIAVQLELSSQKVARTCRSVILATSQITIEATTPHPYVFGTVNPWNSTDILTSSLSFTAPMYAAITLFMHILRRTDQPSNRADIALLNVCAGHFARLEFATDSEISFPFVSEIAALARKNIRCGRQDHAKPRDRSIVRVHNELNGSQDDQEARALGDGPIDSVIHLGNDNSTVSLYPAYHILAARGRTL